MFHVKKDSREQKNGGGWIFEKTDKCSGMTEQKLETGDYTIVGYENIFTVERKGSVSEWAHNVNEERFERELERLEEFKYPFIILEFTMADLMKWPQGCGIPKEKIKEIKVSSLFLLRRTCEMMVKYKTKIIFAGTFGKEIATSIFKRIIENGK